MKIVSVVGARPNFMKVAPLVAAIDRYNAEAPAYASGDAPQIEHMLVHTGQHYDEAMSGSFFKDLGLPAPDVHLGVGSGSHAAQTAEIMKRFEPVLLDLRPDVVLVAGDVNSTVACALVASKAASASGARTRVAHMESGLRSFDRSMPEEINRILTDHLSDLLFVTEPSGLKNLAHEGIPAEKVFFVGNTMIDSLVASRNRARRSDILQRLGLLQSCGSAIPLALLTLHRPANVDNREALIEILEGLRDLASAMPVVFPAHPRTRSRITEFGLDTYFGGSPSSSGIMLTGPLGYLDFLCLMSHAVLAATDSGGIQEETTCLGVPCVTLRDNTERPVTITEGTNMLGGVGRQGIREAITKQLRSGRRGHIPEKWDGRAAGRIVSVLAARFCGDWRGSLSPSPGEADRNADVLPSLT